MKFKIGDPVWASCDSDELGKGELPAVIASFCGIDDYDYYVRIEGHDSGVRGGLYSAKEIWLRPRKPPDEIKREDLGSWDLCPWQPNKVQA